MTAGPTNGEVKLSVLPPGFFTVLARVAAVAADM